MKSAKKIVTFGDLMMRLSPPSHERFFQAKALEINYGGSEANVAVALAHFGMTAEHVTRFSENDFGKAAMAHLQYHGVNTDHIVFGQHRMGLYFLEHGAAHRSTKIIYDRFDSAFANLDPSSFDWPEILKGAAWLHWSGITPAISKAAADACRDAIRAARTLGIKISTDINYRRNLWQYGMAPLEVMPELIAQSDLLVGGLIDFENCMGIKSSDYAEACKMVQANFPSVAIIASTDRESILASHQVLSAVLWNGASLLRAKQYEISQVVDRVGAGDAFMAGLIYGQLNSLGAQETLEFAVASNVLKHTVPGDVNTATVEEVNALVKGENIGKLLR